MRSNYLQRISRIYSSIKILKMDAEKGRRETWDETVSRYFDFSQSI